ncbi:gypsy type transposase [Tanacetum coccineum]
MAITTNEPIVRRPANYAPSRWSYDHIQSFTSNYVDDKRKDDLDNIKEKVRTIISKESAAEKPLSTLQLVDDLPRLGISYHFKDEIRSMLKMIYDYYYEAHENWNKLDLNLKALGFRLLRQHGYHIPQGNIKAHVLEDVVGMLSLYEASFLGVEDENILDKAREFTIKCLEEKLEKNTNENESLWCNYLGWAKKLEFTRDRLVESFMWGVAGNYEPDFGLVTQYCESDMLEARWFYSGYTQHLKNIKFVLTQKGLDMFCHNFHIPEDVHSQLPSPNQTIHEMPTGKISVYTRFFEYANFRLPLSTFLVNVLRHYRINLSQLSVITATKVSHFEILCRVHNIEPIVGLFHCSYVNSNNKGWMSFSKRPDSDARERAEGEARLLDSIVGRVVPLLPVPPARADSELEASVDRLFDEGGSADQGNSAAGGDQDAETELVTGVKIIADENVVAEKPKRPRKKRPAVTDASGSSHPPKKLRGDYGTSSGAATGGKSPSVLKELLASSMLNVEAGVAAVATDSSRHSSTHTSGAEGDSVIRSAVVPPMITEAVVTSHAVNAPSVPVLETGSKLNAETLYQVFVPQWNVLNDSLLDDSDVSREFVDHLAPPALFSQIREMDYHHLFTEFNIGTDIQEKDKIKAKTTKPSTRTERP